MYKKKITDKYVAQGLALSFGDKHTYRIAFRRRYFCSFRGTELHRTECGFTRYAMLWVVVVRGVAERLVVNIGRADDRVWIGRMEGGRH